MNESQAASTLQLLGAGGFGAIIGWYIYYINRYRKSVVCNLTKSKGLRPITEDAQKI